MISSYVSQGQQALRRWLRDPLTHQVMKLTAHVLTGFCLSAASLEQQCMPLVMGFVWACRGWRAVLAALGGTLGYWVFWGQSGVQGLVWTCLALAGALFLADKRISRELPLLIPAVGMLMVSASGLGFQLWAGDMTAVPIYLLRVALGGAAPWVFIRGAAGKDPVARWLSWGMLTLGLAQIAPVHWLGLGYVTAGAVSVVSAFPCAAAVGLALDLAAITPIPMTAVVVSAFFVRFLPRCPRSVRCCAPGALAVVVMYVCSSWDMAVLPGLFIGGAIGCFLPGAKTSIPRRGETGVAQVRLEMAAGVLAQTQQLLMEVRETPVDEDALAARAAERACAGCAYRKSCRDCRRVAQLPGALLRKPLLTVEELPIQCRKGNRLLAELHRSQEQLRSIRADRERQREYRAAVVQQYQFLSRYLRDLSDRLSDRVQNREAIYDPLVCVYGNRGREDNGDRCLQFAGTQNQYYIVLCDGMGTGMGAVQEGVTAGELLRQMLSCGFPASAALGSLNSLCALRERAASVTVDLVQIALDTGKVTIYKWGAAPSYLVSRSGTEKLGAPSVPPGLSVVGTREMTCTLHLRREQILLLVSDGVEEEQVLGICRENTQVTAEGLARDLLEGTDREDQDDATVVTIQLLPAKP